MYYDCPVCGEENEISVTESVNEVFGFHMDITCEVELGDNCQCELSDVQMSKLMAECAEYERDNGWDLD